MSEARTALPPCDWKISDLNDRVVVCPAHGLVAVFELPEDAELTVKLKAGAKHV